ncbi:MAG: hypothetical protein ACI88C_000067 [Acidimicrobiales bacterium]
MSTGRSEAAIQRDILAEFGAQKFCRIWRMNVGMAVPTHGNRPVMFGVKGMADTEGILDFRHSKLWRPGMLPVSGIKWCIEVKREKGGRVRDSQEKMMRCIERFGGIYMITRSVEEVWAMLGELGFER